MAGNRKYFEIARHNASSAKARKPQLYTIIQFNITHQVCVYSPFSFSCFTAKAVSNNFASSLVCEAFNPVATEALGSRPAYMTCFRSWCSVLFKRVSIRGCVNDQAPALRGSSWHQTMVLALGYVSRFSFNSCQGKGLSCSIRVIAVSLIPLSARYLCKAT